MNDLQTFYAVEARLRGHSLPKEWVAIGSISRAACEVCGAEVMLDPGRIPSAHGDAITVRCETRPPLCSVEVPVSVPAFRAEDEPALAPSPPYSIRTREDLVEVLNG